MCKHLEGLSMTRTCGEHIAAAEGESEETPES